MLNTTAQILNVVLCPIIIVAVGTMINSRIVRTANATAFAALLATIVAIGHLTVAAMSAVVEVYWRMGASVSISLIFACMAVLYTQAARRMRQAEYEALIRRCDLLS